MKVAKVSITKRKKRFYDTAFKEQAVALAEEIGIKMAQEKLDIAGEQVLRNWVNKKNKKKATDSEADGLREEIKKLKKELEKEKKITAILKDATIFFCQDQQK